MGAHRAVIADGACVCIDMLRAGLVCVLKEGEGGERERGVQEIVASRCVRSICDACDGQGREAVHPRHHQ